jgi:hypothetical protein
VGQARGRRTLTALSAARAVLPYGLGVTAAGLAVAGVWVDQPAFGAGGTVLGLCTAVLERRRCGSVLTQAAGLRERLRRQRVESGDAAARLRQEVRTLQVQLWEHQLRAIPVADLPALPLSLPTADPQLAVPTLPADPGDPAGDLVAELTSAWFDAGPEVAETELADADAGPELADAGSVYALPPVPGPEVAQAELADADAGPELADADADAGVELAGADADAEPGRADPDHAEPVHAERVHAERVHAEPVHAEPAPMPETAPIPIPQVSDVIEAIRARVIDLGSADIAAKAERIADVEVPADIELPADPETATNTELRSAVPASAR